MYTFLIWFENIFLKPGFLQHDEFDPTNMKQEFVNSGKN